MSKNHNPLVKRTFKYKNAHIQFYCPLCGTKRAMVTDPHLSLLNYLQVTLMTVALTAVLYPFMGMKGIFSFFLIWAIFEAALRINFRKEVPCPHCGFDASWYKKDVNVAKQKVEEFWKTNNQADDTLDEGSESNHDEYAHTDLAENNEETTSY